MPMLIVHFWLPKPQVQAPVSGSMILVSVLLQLSVYGLLCVFPVLFRFGFGIIWVASSLVGGLVSLFCIHQTDLKSLIVYSSVAHMSMVVVL
jgi:NADH:ubiquinone oxidoreductase subunit 4 (subunit M)